MLDRRLLYVAVVGLFLLEGSPAAVAQSVPSVTFGPATKYPVGSSDYSTAVGDFNLDGFLDLAVTDNNNDCPCGGWVGIQLNDGNGNFGQVTYYDAGVNPISVAVGDFNSDGSPDLAVGGENGTAILLNNGDGTFGAATLYGPAVAFVAVADVNSDSKLDLIVANGTGVSVMLGNGDGTFQQPTSYVTGARANSVAVADFNSDGKSDLAVTNANNDDVSVLLGNGDGTFRQPVNYGIGMTPVSVAVADFNGDGNVDLAAANQGAATVSVLLGNGDGTFRHGGPLSTDRSPTEIVVADFNHDGKPDLAVSNQGGNPAYLQVFLGIGNGQFQAPLRLPVDFGMQSVTAGDLNNDGYPSLAAVGLFSLDTILNLPTPIPTFSSTNLIFGDQLVGTVSSPQTVKLTNTGDLDLVLSSVVTTGSFIQTNKCGGSLAPLASCAVQVSYNATAEGTQTGATTFTDNALGNPQAISLQGQGTVVKIAPPSLNFGSVPVGTTSPAQTVKVSNTSSGAVALYGVSISGANAGDFAETTTCVYGLRPKTACTVSVTFTPTATGSRSATLNISDSGGGSPQTASLTGTGE